MDALIWVLLPLITAVGSALLAFYIMQARLEVVVAKEREALVEARAMMKSHERQLEDRVKMTEEETRRRSFDDFLGDIRVEERHYMRENKSLFTNTKSMVLQERLYFRNLPLSNWVEHELTVEQGQTAELANLARAASVFSAQNAALQAGVQAGGAQGSGGAMLQAAQAAAPVTAPDFNTAQSFGAGVPVMVTSPASGTPLGAKSFGAANAAPEAAPAPRRGFGAPRSTAPTSKVATLTADGTPGQLTFSPRFSQSRLLRG
jgi:hypothetical protein